MAKSRNSGNHQKTRRNYNYAYSKSSKGELHTRSAKAENKFIAFKRYAEKYKINFGFVRDINEELFINNTEYHEDMSHDSWKPLSDFF